MFWHHFKIAYRHIWRNKIFSVINIIGLSISIACCILILLFVRHEFSYDQFNKNANRIFRLTLEIHDKNGYNAHFARTTVRWTKEMKDCFPEIEDIAELSPNRYSTVKINNIKCTFRDAFYADSSIFNVFSIDLLKGNPAKVLSEPNTIAISESIAHKYFSNANPVGHPIIITGYYNGKEWSTLNYTITGVFKDLPVNSHIHPQVLFSKVNSTSWYEDWRFVYILLKKNSTVGDVMKKFPAFLKKQGEIDSAKHVTIPHLQPISDIHLNSHKDRELEANGSMLIVYIMCLTGLIVLIVSWINYLNLTLAGVYNRSRSLYLLKVNAASSADLFYIYLIESAIIVFISFYLAIIIIEISFPYIKTITGNVLNENIFQFIPFASFWVCVILLGTLIIGGIPILSFTLKNNSVLAFFRPGKSGDSKKPSSFARVLLIIVQFSLTVFLIISSLVIGTQSRYILNHQTGADEDSVVFVRMFNQDILAKYELIKSELLKSPHISDVTASFEEPYGETMDAMGFDTRGIRDEFKNQILWIYAIDDNYFDFYNISIVAGCNFPPYNEKLKREDYILNETAVKSLGWTPEEAIGKPFKLRFSYDANVIFGGRIVGVVKDFSVNTLHREIRPFVFFQKKIWYWSLLIKIDRNNRKKAMSDIQKTWDELVPNYPLDYLFNKDLYFKAYKKEIIQSRMSGFFSILAILISCLGLFAISSIIITRRTKEIGIRKTNGAKTWEIILMLTKDFMKWVLVAYLIACPAAYIVMNNWLKNFAYKTPIHWWIFVIAGIIIFLVALLTVGFQSLKVASKNPVESLRYE